MEQERIQSVITERDEMQKEREIDKNPIELWNMLSKLAEKHGEMLRSKDKFPPRLATKFTKNKSQVGRGKTKGKQGNKKTQLL